jgi:hypothetical protein
MGEFFQNYGFFILVALLMLVCHMGHGGHGRKHDDSRKDDDSSQRTPERPS